MGYNLVFYMDVWVYVCVLWRIAPNEEKPPPILDDFADSAQGDVSSLLLSAHRFCFSGGKYKNLCPFKLEPDRNDFRC